MSTSRKNDAYARGIRIINHGQTVVKYWPLLDFVVLWTHVVLLLHGYNTPVADMGFSLSLVQMVAWLAASYAFGYCSLHRAYIIYNALVSACINYQQHFDFGEYLTPARWVVVFIGMVLIVHFIIFRTLGHCKDRTNIESRYERA